MIRPPMNSSGTAARHAPPKVAPAIPATAPGAKQTPNSCAEFAPRAQMRSNSDQHWQIWVTCWSNVTNAFSRVSIHLCDNVGQTWPTCRPNRTTSVDRCPIWVKLGNAARVAGLLALPGPCAPEHARGGRRRAGVARLDPARERPPLAAHLHARFSGPCHPMARPT